MPSPPEFSEQLFYFLGGAQQKKQSKNKIKQKRKCCGVGVVWGVGVKGWEGWEGVREMEDRWTQNSRKWTQNWFKIDAFCYSPWGNRGAPGYSRRGNCKH